MALMTIAQHHGRPGTPTDQAHVESFFSHLKGDWPHLTGIRDPAALDAELARTATSPPTTSITAAGPASAAPAPPGCAERRAEPIKQNRAHKA